MREDGRQQVCIVGLKEYRVSDVELVKEYIDKGNLSRSTGSTGANEESSRSHAILQLVVKKAQEGKEVNRVVGKISFIDLAGSERGADTTDNDRQTRSVYLSRPLQEESQSGNRGIPCNISEDPSILLANIGTCHQLQSQF